MNVLSGWHLVVLSLLTVVPIVVVGGLVLIAIMVRRSAQARSEERIARRTAELLRSQGPRRR